MKLSLRRPLGIIALILGLFAYVLIAVIIMAPISQLHVLLQLPIWILLGIGWIFPARPLMIWIETGKWRV